MTKKIDSYLSLLEKEIEIMRNKKEYADNPINFQYYLGEELALQRAYNMAKFLFKETE